MAKPRFTLLASVAVFVFIIVLLSSGSSSPSTSDGLPVIHTVQKNAASELEDVPPVEDRPSRSPKKATAALVMSESTKKSEIVGRSVSTTVRRRGMFSPRTEAEKPYRDVTTGKCRPTDEKFDLTGTGGAVPNLGKGTIPRDCVNKLETMNPELPFRNVADKCAKHIRRWGRTNLGKHIGHLDWDEIDKRQSNVKMLASTAECVKGTGFHTGKRIYIDAGCRNYSSSVGWFREHYPEGHSFYIHAFDVDKKYGKWYKHDTKATFHNAAVWNQTGFVTFFIGGKYMMGAQGAAFHAQESPPPRAPPGLKGHTVASVGLANFLLEETKPEDFVVLKIDVEGSEWQLLQHLVDHPEAFRRVDEVFMECHSFEWNPGWPHDRTLADCHRMFNALREAGVYVHEWY